MEKTVVELFAGVGGFRVGLNNIKQIDSYGHAVENGVWKFLWSNQWEPSTRAQHAFDCYNLRFSDQNNSNCDISLVDKKTIPNHTLLCGGFPCQDYSVAHTISKSKGIEGKKGVLWWQINEILEEKRPPFVLLENVDRLIKSPVKQRGRDFGIMLRCLQQLGYGCEWRVINAAEYGHPQRRRRIFIFAFHKETNYYKLMKKTSPNKVMLSAGLFAKKFPVLSLNKTKIKKILFVKGYKDLVSVSDKFSAQFENSGFSIDGCAYTAKLLPIIEPPATLNEIVIKSGVDSHYFLTEEKIKKFKYLRGAKKIPRKNKSGFEYLYSEGSMSKSDELTLPARTMLTSEGTTNRSSHIIKDPKNKKLRFLTPIECERINQFPDNWTDSGMSERRRYFMMGNALVCGIIKKIGELISEIVDDEQ